MWVSMYVITERSWVTMKCEMAFLGSMLMLAIGLDVCAVCVSSRYSVDCERLPFMLCAWPCVFLDCVQ